MLSTAPEPAPTPEPAPAIPRFSVAGAFLEALAGRDFDGLAATLAPDVHVRGLTPGGFGEWQGRPAVRAQFAAWFDHPTFELVDAVVGEIGSRLHLRWRARRHHPTEPRWSVVEQQVYADTDAAGRIARLSLLCSGFQREGAR
jgi:hypothetical protein